MTKKKSGWWATCLLDFDGVCDDLDDARLAGLVVEMPEEEAGEVAVETFVAGDQLVGEGQTWNQRGVKALKMEDIQGAAKRKTYSCCHPLITAKAEARKRERLKLSPIPS